MKNYDDDDTGGGQSICERVEITHHVIEIKVGSARLKSSLKVLIQ